jgi:glucuronate isomerase
MTTHSYTTHKFLDANFMLNTEIGEKLFHEIAKDLPIIDFHNHINPLHLSRNEQFADITGLWIQNDPYKHRAMRINGVPEHFITGGADPWEKFFHWAKTVPYTIGNPLFHWTALELKRVFDIDDVLSEANAADVWSYCNEVLSKQGLGAADVVRKFNAELLVTSDELLDDLREHNDCRSRGNGFTVEPSLRCDAVLALDRDASSYFVRLSEKTGISIQRLDELKGALLSRIDYFATRGCRLADHALDAGFQFDLVSGDRADAIFTKIIGQEHVSHHEVMWLRSDLLHFLGQEYGKRNWAMQLHIGAQRNTSSRLRSLVGAAGGFAAIGKSCDISSLCTFLDALEKAGHLPRTILYTLNPADNEAFASITGSFSQDDVPGKIQFGPAWWYNDHAEGIRSQLKTVRAYGLISRFIGMTTDSRSVLSLSRHEYFRRVFCNLIGEWVNTGALPREDSMLERIVKDVSYFNIKNWLQQ